MTNPMTKTTKPTTVPQDYQYEHAGTYYKIRTLAGKDRVLRWVNGEWIASSWLAHEMRRAGKMRGALPLVKPARIVRDEEQLPLELPEPEYVLPAPNILSAGQAETAKPKRRITKKGTEDTRGGSRRPEAPRLPNGTPVLVNGISVGVIQAADRVDRVPENYCVKIDGVHRWVDATRVVVLKPDHTINPLTGEPYDAA